MIQRTLEGAEAEGRPAIQSSTACGESHDWKARADGTLRCRVCHVALPAFQEGDEDSWAALAYTEDVLRPRAKLARAAFWREIGR